MVTEMTAPITKDTLLPCPFCGSPAHFGGNEKSIYVACDGIDCFATLGECYDRDAMPDHCFSDEETAAAFWNRRSQS